MEEFFSVITGIAVLFFSVVGFINKQKKTEQARALQKQRLEQQAQHPGVSVEQQAQLAQRMRELSNAGGLAPLSPSVAPASVPVNYYRNPIPQQTPTIAAQVVPAQPPMAPQMPMRPILQTPIKPRPQPVFDPEGPCALGGTHSAGHSAGVPEGFSTMQPRALEREELKVVDLGKQRAMEQRVNTQSMSQLPADQWMPPEETAFYGGSSRKGTSAAYNPAQLREAIILKEILDAPISRRRARRLQV